MQQSAHFPTMTEAQDFSTRLMARAFCCLTGHCGGFMLCLAEEPTSAILPLTLCALHGRQFFKVSRKVLLYCNGALILYYDIIDKKLKLCYSATKLKEIKKE